MQEEEERQIQQNFTNPVNSSLQAVGANSASSSWPFLLLAEESNETEQQQRQEEEQQAQQYYNWSKWEERRHSHDWLRYVPRKYRQSVEDDVKMREQQEREEAEQQENRTNGAADSSSSWPF